MAAFRDGSTSSSRHDRDRMLDHAFNALTLTPALSAMLLRRSAAHRPLQRFYACSTVIDGATEAMFDEPLARAESANRHRGAPIIRPGDYLLVKRLPTSFVPRRHGYFSSTSAAARRVAGTNGRNLPAH